jgi:heme/copper-type cytochrome/quinol oxidase subunit 3
MRPGADQMASTFFAVTGFHGAHVLAGVVLLAIFALRAARGRTAGVATIAIYWQFVDVAWLFIFAALYLA